MWQHHANASHPHDDFDEADESAKLGTAFAWAARFRALPADHVLLVRTGSSGNPMPQIKAATHSDSANDYVKDDLGYVPRNVRDKLLLRSFIGDRFSSWHFSCGKASKRDDKADVSRSWLFSSGFSDPGIRPPTSSISRIL